MSDVQLPPSQLDRTVDAALRRLAAFEPAEVIALPPRRLSIDDGLECLVEWRPAAGSDWLLRLTQRPTSVDAANENLPQFEAIFRAGAPEPTVKWSQTDDRFTEWVGEALPEIVATISGSLSVERQRIAVRSATSAPGTSFRDFIPHMVILVAIAAFVYMFAIVHINL